MSEYRELLIGCGHQRDKRLDPRDAAPLSHPPAENLRTWRGVLETLDLFIECRPDWVCNLQRLPWAAQRVQEDESCQAAVMLEDDTYDEVHAYEVLEHLGRQGDYHSFFAHFSEIWRILKPGGYLCATVPAFHSRWAWGDPGHTRVILPESLVFLTQPNYDAQQGRTAMSDYRRDYRADFDLVRTSEDLHTHRFVLRAVKPSRVTLS
jgi:SAM-dependent methyltransferase